MCKSEKHCAMHGAYGMYCNSFNGLMCSEYSMSDKHKTTNFNVLSNLCATQKKTKTKKFFRNRIEVKDGLAFITVNDEKIEIKNTGVQANTVYWISRNEESLNITTRLPSTNTFSLLGICVTDNKGNWDKCNII